MWIEMEKKWAVVDYLPAVERVECAEDGDLGIAGGCWLRCAGDDEGACICDGAVGVEGVEDELLEGLCHGG